MNRLRYVHELVEHAPWSRPSLDTIAQRIHGHHLDTLVQRLPAPALKPSGAHTVSVVIPCFNYALYLPAAIDSVLRQEGVDVQVIVVDDASSDDSLAVAEYAAERDARILVERNPSNQGHVRTFNSGLALATGDFVARLDADDLLTPGSLSRAVAMFEAHPSVGLVYGHPRHFTSEVPPPGRVGHVSWTVWAGRDWLEERCRRGVNCITTPEAVVRHSVIRDVGPLDIRLRYAQDMEMWLRVAAVSNVGRINDVDQALHRDHDSSMSETDGSGVMTDLSERRTVFECVFDAVGERIPNAQALRRMAMEQLASEALARAHYASDRGRHDQTLTDELMSFARETSPQRVRRAKPLARRPARFWDAAALARVARTRSRSELEYFYWSRFGL